MAKRDYYDVLGVPRTATPDDIRSSYRRLARQHHPDMNKDNPKASEERFKELSEAYEVLADEEKRRRYDQAGFSAVETDFGPQGFTWQNFTHAQDLEDLLGNSAFFEQLFGSGMADSLFGATRTRRSGPANRGSDIEVTVRLPLADAVTGAEPTLEVPHTGRCEDCRGTGAKRGTALETCPECEGRGQLRRTQTRGYAQLISITECPMCHGAGRRIREKCPTCEGSGIIRHLRKLKVTIPPGMEDGAVLRLARQGVASGGIMIPGDLFVQVIFEPVEGLRREGRDAFTETRVPLSTAMFGGEVRVPTITSDALLKIPPSTQPESQFRMRGEGFPRFRGGDRGDLIVTLHVEVPRSLSSRQKDLLKEALASVPGPDGTKRSGLFGRRS
ncbi:MAG: J domain-containing protein [Thermoplasmata archaeon]|nr:J domain-containing protein [Thermoplasmata archaeon]